MLPWARYHETIQTFGSLLAAADFVERCGAPEELYVDHFEARLSYAWNDLRRKATHMHIIPWGDEVNPLICAADIIGTLTDHRLSARYTKLRRDTLPDLWHDKPFSVEGRYWTRQHLPWIEWRSNSLVPVGDHYPRPMVYILADNDLLGATANAKDATRFRDLPEAQPFLDVPLIEACRRGAGVKFFAGKQDVPYLRGGDTLDGAGECPHRLQPGDVARHRSRRTQGASTPPRGGRPQGPELRGKGQGIQIQRCGGHAHLGASSRFLEPTSP